MVVCCPVRGNPATQNSDELWGETGNCSLSRLWVSKVFCVDLEKDICLLIQSLHKKVFSFGMSIVNLLV